jgi:hypothetical protein
VLLLEVVSHLPRLKALQDQVELGELVVLVVAGQLWHTNPIVVQQLGTVACVLSKNQVDRPVPGHDVEVPGHDVEVTAVSWSVWEHGQFLRWLT